MDSPEPTSPARRRFDPLLAMIVLVAAILGALLLSRAKNWGLMTDELVYSGIGQSIAHTIVPLPELRGAPIAIYQVLYPTLIAPIVGPLSMPLAYPWLAVLNAFLFALAAIPAYLLASRATGSRAAARWVALCTVITPWLIFGSKVLPDATAYLAALWAIYAIVRTAGGGERAWKGDALALLAIALAYFVRTQFLLLLGVWIGSVILIAAARAVESGTWREVLRVWLRLPRERPLVFTVFVLGLLVLLIRPSTVLGTYVVTTQSIGGGPVAVSGLLKALADHASVLALGIGALPVVLGLPWLLAATGRFKSHRQNDFAIVAILALLAMLYVGTNFDLRFDPGDRVIERYIFYVAPLLLVAMAGLYTDPPKNLVAFAIPALLGLLLLGVTQPYGLDTKLNLLINHGFAPTQITLIAWQKVAGVVTSIFGMLAVISLVLCIFVWWAIEGGRAALARDVSFTLLAAILLASTIYTVPKVVDLQNDLAAASFGVRSNDQKNWVDRAAGDRPVALVYSKQVSVDDRHRARGGASPAEWWDVAFWNKSIDTVYLPYRATALSIPPIPGANHKLTPDWRSGRLTRVPGDSSQYLLLAGGNPNFAPQAERPPQRGGGFKLYAAGHDPVAAWATRGLSLGGWLPPDGATLRVWAPRDASQATVMRIELVASTRTAIGDAQPMKIDDTGAQKVRIAGNRISFVWSAKIPPGGHADFVLTRGARGVHIDSIALAPTRQRA